MILISFNLKNIQWIQNKKYKINYFLDLDLLGDFLAVLFLLVFFLPPFSVFIFLDV